MSESYESSLPDSALISFLPESAPPAARRQWDPAPVTLSAKRSLGACAFLLFYVALYLGAGFAGVTVVERLWSALYQ